MTLTVPPRSACTIRSAPVVRDEGARTVVRLEGEWDFSTRPALCDELSRVIAMRSGDVVVDLAATEFMDTATVRDLVAAYVALGRRSRELTFRSPSRPAARLLELFGLTRLIEVGQRPLP